MRIVTILLLAAGRLACASAAQEQTPPLTVQGTFQMSMQTTNASNSSPNFLDITNALGNFNLTAGTGPASNAPVKFEGKIEGTANLPPEFQKRTGLPQQIQFNLQIKTEAQEITKQPLTSRAECSYSIQVKEADSKRVVLDLNSRFTLENPGEAKKAQDRISEIIGQSLRPLLGVDTTSSALQQSPTNTPAGK